MSRLPFPGGPAGNLAVILGLFGISMAVGAGLGKWSSARSAEPEGTALVSDEPIFQEVNFSPLLGLGGPIETLLYDQDPETDIYEQSLSEVESEAGLKKEFYVITTQDNLFTALQCFGVNRDIIVHWIELAKKEYNLARLKPGQSFWLSLDQARRPVRLEFNIDRRRRLVIQKSKDDYEVHAERVEERETTLASAGESIPKSVPVPAWVDPTTGDQYFRGTVTASFYQAAVAAGMTPAKVMALIRIFGGVNFDREIKPGDEFRVVVAPGQKPGEEGPILAAMVETGGKPRYRFRVEQGKTADYYNEKGETGRKASGFICPVRFRRISSGYSGSRFHPILHCYRPHLGIDYAARSGTPVRAAADGTVTYASWKGQFGRTVAIRHGSYVSQYAHLSGFGAGIKPGKVVKQGQVVGYVGATGLATGPHLDYRIYKGGTPVNPARVSALPAPPVKDKKAFGAVKGKYLGELSRQLPLGPARPLTPPVVKTEVN